MIKEGKVFTVTFILSTSDVNSKSNMSLPLNPSPTYFNLSSIFCISDKFPFDSPLSLILNWLRVHCIKRRGKMQCIDGNFRKKRRQRLKVGGRSSTMEVVL